MFSIWERTGFGPEADLVVVGAGITGCFAALHYQRRFPAHRVLVLERGPHPSGASMKNAGFACFGSPSEILADIDAEGIETAVVRVEERWLGLRELRRELGDERIGFESTGGHELFADDDPLYNRVAGRFDELNDALSPVFGGPVYEWRNGVKGDMDLCTGNVAFTPLEGPLNSAQLMRTLLDKVREAGVEVRFGHDVLNYEPGATSVEIHLKHQAPVRAARLVLATNGYSSELVPGIDVEPARGQILLTGPIDGLRMKGTFHIAEGYYYFRDYRGCVLLGGGRHLDKAGETTTEDDVTPMIQQALEELLRSVILPGRTFQIAHRWSGVMGFRAHGKSALVDHLAPRVVVVAGLSGMGVAIGVRVARKAIDLLLDRT